VSTNVEACTTFVAGRRASVNGAVLSTHSNDGDGDTAGNVKKVPKGSYGKNATRRVSGGYIPQISRTFGYLTKIGGYASINENQVGLAESTCASIFGGNESTAKLNIVDLSELCLERSSTARDCIEVMGSLAELHGYYDSGESLIVTDKADAYIFHVSPDDSGTSAIWIAQRVAEDHVAVVANMWIIREVNLTDDTNFLYSKNLLDVALRSTSWTRGTAFDFTLLFSKPEGRKYVSGRRMWRVLDVLTDVSFPMTYGDLVRDAPYPATAPARASKIDVSNMRDLMRDYYNGTDVSMVAEGNLAAGPFLTPDRSTAGANEDTLNIYFERTISTHRTIVSYVLVLSDQFPDEMGTIWLSFHAAHTSFYVPLVVGATQLELPRSHTANVLDRVDRGVSAFNAARFVHNVAQMHFNLAIMDVREAQKAVEENSSAMISKLRDEYASGLLDVSDVAKSLAENAENITRTWWTLSDSVLLRYADGYCNDCGRGPRHLGYPTWWLRDVSSGLGPL